jgi:hypothetical protein
MTASFKPSMMLRDTPPGERFEAVLHGWEMSELLGGALPI